MSLNYGHMTEAGEIRLQNQVSLYFLNNALAMQVLRLQGASEPPGRLQKTQVSDSVSLSGAQECISNTTLRITSFEPLTLDCMFVPRGKFLSLPTSRPLTHF